MRTPGAFCKPGSLCNKVIGIEQWPFSIPEGSCGPCSPSAYGGISAARPQGCEPLCGFAASRSRISFRGLVLLLGVDTGTVLVESTSDIVTFEPFPCQAKCDIFVVDFTPHGGDGMGESKQITEVLSNAWQQGIEIGQDINQSRAEQRMIVAQRVKALRSAKGISQEKMSNIIHANTLTYRGYENCKSDIPLFYLVRIADALETSLDYLAGRTEIREQSSLEQRGQKLETIVLKGTDS